MQHATSPAVSVAKQCTLQIQLAPSLLNANSHTVAISQLPTIQVRATSPTDWFAIGSLFVGALATVLVVLAGAWLTDRSNRKHAEELREQANAGQRAASRQAWIDTLRDSLAEYIGCLKRLWDLHQLKLGREPALRQHVDSSYVLQETQQHALTQNQLVAEAERVRAKIKLLLNPAEPNYGELERLLDRALDCARDGDINVLPACNNLVQAFQPVLKAEWERVKARE
ncbi:hypothetical protein [Paludibacterium purpuratum]|uniref:Uncharacterized protein n=1 Tax=Paludibacterium purpuratum TaxID=1144873 RepID=A0A4R7AWW2_9NEIS|nr:hypothetical protein [Paludibacterium purpuratum]TDR72048.1 hypothetical protein DFP86_11756 [Paludibacterium purpuratum]